jgi:hypothetical protein
MRARIRQRGRAGGDAAVPICSSVAVHPNGRYEGTFLGYRLTIDASRGER